MGKVFLDYCEGVPRFGCTDCGKCNSVMGTSLGSITKRGCCSYYPEFNLAEIHRLVNIPGGRQILDKILENPGTEVHQYYIHAKGKLEKQAYEDYLAKSDLIETTIRDHTIFFRTCPFVIPEKGCMLEPQFRTTVCNFFVCSEILECYDHREEFAQYIEARTTYSRWIYRESQELQHIFHENGLNLCSDFEGCIKLLSEMPLSAYEFPDLQPVEYLLNP